MADHKTDDAALDALFQTAREDEAPSDAFLAALMADAETAIAENATKPVEPSSPTPTPFWQKWLPATGLTAATLAGVWIGISLPESDFGTVYLADFSQTESIMGDFVPSFGVGGIVEDSQ